MLYTAVYSVSAILGGEEVLVFDCKVVFTLRVCALYINSFCFFFWGGGYGGMLVFDCRVLFILFPLLYLGRGITNSKMKRKRKKKRVCDTAIVAP